MGSARSRRRTRSDQSERGAVVVEFAILAPLLVLILFGAAELGFAWQTASKAETSVAGAARVAAQVRGDSMADFEILRSVAGGMSDKVDDLERVVIYNSTSTDGRVPAACLSGSALANGGVAGVCSVYRGSFVSSVSATDFSTAPGGCRTANMWCPAQRVDPPDVSYFIGIHVVVDHAQVVGFLPGGDRDIGAFAVARMEPRR